MNRKLIMTGNDGSMREVLNGYAKFLQETNLALDKHQPYLVRWVAEFLRFARAHAGYSFEQTLDLFLAEVGGNRNGDITDSQASRVGRAQRNPQFSADAVCDGPGQRRRHSLNLIL